MSTRIYLVSEKEAPESAGRLVRASTPAQAIRHVATDLFHVDVASQDDIVRQVAGGVKVEVARGDAQ